MVHKCTLFPPPAVSSLKNLYIDPISLGMQLEEESLRDRREREELERNIRQRDADRTRKVMFYMKLPLVTSILSW